MQTKACRVSSNGEHAYVPASKETRVFENDNPPSHPVDMMHSTGSSPRQTVEEITTAVYCRRCGDVQDLRPAPAVWVDARPLDQQPR